MSSMGRDIVSPLSDFCLRPRVLNRLIPGFWQCVGLRDADIHGVSLCAVVLDDINHAHSVNPLYEV